LRLLAGTSGFSYQEWKGPFYPAELPDREMLGFYGQRLPAVEINNTFYRMPRAEMLAGWREKVRPEFRFVLKAPQRITHRERLDGAESVATFWMNAQALGERLGPVLFQLPPTLRADLEKLKRFTGGLPDGMRAAFEFRHPSWTDPAVVDVLRDAGCALCVADTDEGETPAIVPTGDWGYARLRRTRYSDADLIAWSQRLRAQPWREVYVFFKHEDEGAAPRMALRMTSASEHAWQ
jgi:uncharacterized protein YecE (DUF72 family)